MLSEEACSFQFETKQNYWVKHSDNRVVLLEKLIKWHLNLQITIFKKMHWQSLE